jgi:hypothetical protein
VPWRLVDEVPGPALLIEVQIGGPPCDEITGVDVEEALEAVDVRVWAGRTSDASCGNTPAALATARLRVATKRPIGGRTVRGDRPSLTVPEDAQPGTAG